MANENLSKKLDHGDAICGSDMANENFSKELDHGDAICGSGADEFFSYINHSVDQNQLKNLQEKYQREESVSWSQLHSISFMCRQASEHTVVDKTVDRLLQAKENVADVFSDADLVDKMHIKNRLATNWLKMCTDQSDSPKAPFTALQQELYLMMSHYYDLYYPCLDVTKTVKNIQNIYCLHVLNHLLKSQSHVLKNNENIAKMTAESRENSEFQDQGFVRPKVLILVPFRETALRVISIMLSLLKKGTKFEVSYKKRFKEEFSQDETDITETFEKMKAKPSDYQALFAGNTDERFQIGIAILRNSVRLYAPFYSSDIIVASPLGLRTCIGEKGEAHYEHDFLSSIEILVVDHADVALMQNWEHVLHIIQKMHLQPKESHDVDFSRVRNWALDGHSKYYCQSIVLSSINSPQVSSLLTKYCFNHRGLAVISRVNVKGSICSIPSHTPQIFHRLDASTFVSVADKRFEFFVQNILKKIKESKATHTLVYIPQYYDFVRVRNHMRREMKSGAGPKFAHICEYTDPKVVGKSRRSFVTGKARILLYTERYHFYHRPYIRGITQIVFYELPTFPHFYSELCNMMYRGKTSSALNPPSATVIYSRFDSIKLASIVGDARCDELRRSQKSVHMFVTGSKA